MFADLNFTVETQCPHCGSRNKYFQLSSVHANVRTNLNKGNRDFKADARCEHCDKHFEIKKFRFI